MQLSLNSEVTVEIAHEILIRTWTKLREWLKNNREFCTWQERLNTIIQEWKEGQGELLSKKRLKIAQEWRKTHGQKLSPEQQNFIQKSEEKQMRQLWLGRGIASVIIIVSLWTAGSLILSMS